MEKEKTKKISPVHELVNYYFDIKGWANKNKSFYQENNIVYGRSTKPAKQLLEMCDGNLEEAKLNLKKVAEWAKSRNLDFSIETVFKRWNEIDKLQPIEKKPYYRNCPMVKRFGRKWFVLEKGDWLEFAGLESEIEWR